MTPESRRRGLFSVRVAATAARWVGAVGLMIATVWGAGLAQAATPNAAPQIIYSSSAPKIIYPASAAVSAQRSANTLPGAPAASTASAEAPAWRLFLTVTEYAMPLLALLLVGTLIWWVRARRKGSSNASMDDAALLASLNPRDFEMLIIDAFIAQGYQVSQTGGGVDLVLRKARETSLLQCKHWKRGKVEVKALRELVTVMNARGAAVGIIVTTGRFSREAHDFAERHSLKLIDGPVLGPMIRHAHAARSRVRTGSTLPPPMPVSARPVETAAAPAAFASTTGPASGWPASYLPERAPPEAPVPVKPITPRAPVATRAASIPSTPSPAPRPSLKAVDPGKAPSKSTGKAAKPPIGVSAFVDTEPPCPVCGSGMVLRTVKRGSRAGRVVWSCVNFPACRGVRKAD